MIFKYSQHKDKRFPRVDKVKGVKRLRTIIFVILKYNHDRQYPSPFTTPYPSALAGEGQVFTYLSPSLHLFSAFTCFYSTNSPKYQQHVSASLATNFLTIIAKLPFIRI
ncbi:hypothetical protein [Bacteroides finegoldii]|uniref:hypothetical protein n=1 Tax=Bacteroides finegoldii TaxID=338188 RepID=UPI001389C372|nr:hypothetical protein [Bacteroides finegoldii]